MNWVRSQVLWYPKSRRKEVILLDRISPTGDLVFKKVFASEEHKEILGGFIHDFFGVVAASF
jgi:hypothetical protein